MKESHVFHEDENCDFLALNWLIAQAKDSRKLSNTKHFLEALNKTAERIYALGISQAKLSPMIKGFDPEKDYSPI